MGTLQKLVETLEQRGSLPQRLLDKEVQVGLHQLEAMLKLGVDGDGGGVYQWSKQQLDFGLALVDAVLCASCDLISDGGEKEVVEKIYRLTVQICLQGLETSVLNLPGGMTGLVEPEECRIPKLKRSNSGVFHSELQMQQRLLLLLEAATVEGKAGQRSASVLRSLGEVTSEVPFFNVPSTNAPRETLSNVVSLTSDEPPPRDVKTPGSTLLSLLAIDQLLAHEFTRGSQAQHADVVLKTGNTMVATAQKFAVVQVRCIPRLLAVCQALLTGCEKVMNEEEDRLLHGRIALVSGLMNLMSNLSRACISGFLEDEVASKLIEFASVLHTFFQHTYQLSSLEMDVVLDYNQECLLPSLVDGLLRLAEAVLFDQVAIQNFRTFFVASMLDGLEVDKYRQEGSLLSHQLPLAFTPHVVSHLLGLLRDVPARSSGIYLRQPRNQDRLVGLKPLLACEFRSKKFDLCAVLSPQEQMQILFPSEGKWLDNLVAVTALLHAQGLKEGLVTDIASSTHSEEESVVGSVDSVTVASEDDALFGDLFSESGRHSVNSEGLAPTSSSAKKLDALCNTPLQAVCQVLGFLKDCIFAPDWHQPTFDAACRMLSKEHLDVFLQIHFSQPRLVSQQALSFDPLEGEEGLDPLVQLHKGSFDLLHALVARHALTDSLELHLAIQLLKDSDASCFLSAKSCLLFAKLLIHRFTQRGVELPTDPLAFEIWQNFADFILFKARSIKVVDLHMIKALPSLFHMEVLFMAFHSSDVAGRVIILQNLLGALKSICNNERHLMPGTPFAMWSLLVSRLLLAMRYLILHFNTFPQWLLVHLQQKLQNQAANIHCTIAGEDGPEQSWAGLVACNIAEEQRIGEERAMDELCMQQLFDVSGSLNLQGLQNSQVLMEEVSQVLIKILEIWRGRAFKSAEELIVERYIFLMSWKTVCSISPLLKSVLPWEVNFESSNARSDILLGLSRSLHAGIRDQQACGIDVQLWVGFVMRNLSAAQTLLCEGGLKLLSWDFLRQSSSLSMLLALLQAGFWSFTNERSQVAATASASDSGGNAETGRSAGAIKSLEFLEQAVLVIVRDGYVMELLQSLSILLAWYVEATREAVSHVLMEQHSCRSAALSIELLLQGGLTASKQQELLAAIGISLSKVQSLLRWGSATPWPFEALTALVGPDQVTDRFKDLGSILIPALLHGFPSCSRPGSAAVVSLLLSIESVLDTILGLLHAQELEGGLDQEICKSGLLEDLLSTIMTLKLDSTFESVQSKAILVLNALIPAKEEQALFMDLNELQHAEKLLRLLCNKQNEVIESVWEAVILQALDVYNSIRNDPTRLEALHIYFSLQPHLDDVQQPTKLVASNAFRPLVGLGRVSLLIDVLDGCTSEVVNTKSLQLLVDLLGCELRCKQDLQQRFLDMDTLSFAAWLEQRFLGWGRESPESKFQGWAAAAVRDLASSFFQALLSHSIDVKGEELRTHLLNAMLMNVERAFLDFDIVAAKAYFSLMVQLAVGESLLKQLLRSVVNLVGKLPVAASHLEGLKSMLLFLSSILGAFGQHGDSRQCISNHSSLSGVKIKQSSLRKSSEQLLQMALEPGVMAADCDALSVDDDEDDGTSDGEFTSLDREDDDDVSPTERVLASHVCTFTSSGSNFMEQHWYFCYTCDLTVSKGCCSVCAKVCHQGHKVVYSRLSRFFCDCGAGGVRGTSCLCLKPRKYVSPTTVKLSAGSSAAETVLPFSSQRGQLPPSDSDSDAEDEDHLDADIPFKVFIAEGGEKCLLGVLSELDLEGQVLSLCKRLLTDLNLGHKLAARKDKEVMLGKDKILVPKSDLLQLRRAYKGGSLDMKIKAEYPYARELKSHLASGLLVKSLLTISSRGRLAAGEGDKVTIFDVGQLIGQPSATPVTVDKTTVKPLSKNAVRFELVQLTFNSANESYLAVAGYEDCQVFTVNPRGEVTDRLAVELALQDAYIRRIAWVPGSQVELMVVTNRFVKIYDLSKDKISPTHYFTVLEDSIADAILVSATQGRLMAIVLSQLGVLYSQYITGVESGMRILTENIQLPGCYQPVKGVSLQYSATYKLLFSAYNDNLALIARLNADCTGLAQVAAVVEEQDGKTKAAGLHHWNEMFAGSGLFICLSSQKSNSPVAVQLGTTEMHSQPLRMTGNPSSLRVDGVAAYPPMTKDRNSVLVLYDDGSLQVFSYTSTLPESVSELVGTDRQKQSASLEAERMKKLGVVLLGNRVNNGGATPSFPLDFFEKTTCITADVKLGGDILRNGDSEGVKLSLASDDGFLEGPSSSGFKILVFNSNPELVMVGCRLHVGNTSASHIPSELRVFHRSVRLEEGVRSWYDIPFTNAEALLADEEVTLTIGPTFNGSSLPRVDCLEIYGRSKDDFGWKEKLDAVLALESPAQGSSISSVSSTSKTKHKLMPDSTAPERILSDSLNLLFNYYLVSRAQSTSDSMEIKLEESKKRCLPVLEIVFESDRQLLLQSSARRVLRALYPVKDAYNQAKDNLRLVGVTHSCPILISKMAAGGPATHYVVQEFAAQMRAVCKIALHRPSNLASYLEDHGPSVVHGLVKVLWEILTKEQLDAQTINSLVIPMVDIIYGYAECLSLQHAGDLGVAGSSVSPAVALLQKLLFAPSEPVRTSCSLAISARLLQVPVPKQTMLAMDDVAENLRSSMLSETGSGNEGGGQGMMEEDPSIASVQYCCDGCSTVPILRQRWHCNVCPDFDLCEGCYEVLDPDQLPPPHSRDHPMSSIPVEVDLGGLGEGSELQYSSIDDMSDESLLQMATELSLQASGAPPLVDTTEGRDVMHTVVVEEAKSIKLSASKSAVNSLLLQQLIADIKGWMRTSSGAQAVPVMQLFYRLASAASGPLVDGSPDAGGLTLELFIKLMLQELDLNAPLDVKVRSNFGEVAILVFMFFTLVLRNWHQPGSENLQTRPSAGIQDPSPSSSSTLPVPSSPHDSQGGAERSLQLDRACRALRQQHLVNYLFDIVQQLMHIFKSSSRGVEVGTSSTAAACGALLTVRREFASGSFTPFFSDSYAKAHKGDLFGDYHRLLLESVFRLTYSLLHPEKTDKVEKELLYKNAGATDLNMEGWQDVLCSYINNLHTTSIRKYARRLLLHLCGTKSNYYNVRDAWQLSREVKQLNKLAQKSGGFQTPLAYDRSVKLVKCLSVIAEVAAARPYNWQKYCSRHIDVVQFLLKGVFFFGEESVVQSLKLLTLVFYTGQDSAGSDNGVSASDAVSGGSTIVAAATRASVPTLDGKKKKRSSGDQTGVHDKVHLDMEMAVEQLATQGGSVLRNFIEIFLLEWNATSVRSEAKALLLGAWNHGKHVFRVLLLTSLLDKIPVLPPYGQNIVEYTDLLTWLLAKGCLDATANNSAEELAVRECLTGDVVKRMFGALCAQNELLANHPNSRIYNTLASLVEFDGYYLESEPCFACSSPEVPYTRMKLDSLKSETKFTDNRILVKCVGSHTIQSVMMNVHDARRSKSVKVLNLYYNNRAVADLSELKNNWSLWKRARSCHLAFNQTELKVEFPIPITACNFMIELDSFYENLQASSLESLQCPRCSRYVTDKHGICGNCHENAYQCRQCRNINYENLDSFLCNECGYSKYGRFEFNFMAKPSFTFDYMESDEDMKKGLAAIETESENAHRRYQQLLGFKKPLLKLVSSIGETEIDSQKDSVQQMIVSLPGSSSFKINRKIAILGVLYGEKCKMAFDSVSKSVQTLQGLRQVLMAYLEHKRVAHHMAPRMAPRPTNRCFGCANTFVGQCLEWLQVLCKRKEFRQQLVAAGILRELFENNIHQGPKAARIQARSVLCAFTEGDAAAVAELNSLIKQKTMYCLDHHRSMDIASCMRDELQLLSETCSLSDKFWEARLQLVFQLLFRSIRVGARHPVIAEHIILPCLRIVSQACTPPKPKSCSIGDESASPTPTGSKLEPCPVEPEKVASFSVNTNGTNNSGQFGLFEKDGNPETRGQDAPLVNYFEWKNGATYVDYVRRQSLASQTFKPVVHQKGCIDSKRADFLALKYILQWRRKASKVSVTDELAAFEESSWVHELVLSACSQAIRFETCSLIEVLCAQIPSRRSRFLNLLMNLLPATCMAGESAADYFELLFKMVEPEESRLYLTVRGFLHTTCTLIADEVTHIEAQEHSSHTDISQGYILHKLIELLSKFLQVPNVRAKFMREELLAQVLEALLAIRGLVVQKTKLIGDCGRFLGELLDSFLQESYENKAHFIRACISGLQVHCRDKKGRTPVFILEQLCTIICPMKPEPAYMMMLTKAHTQEEFIRGSMTKNPYSSLEIGPLMRDVKNKICHQLELLGLLEDDYGMELLVAGNIVALDLSVAQVYEQVWKKAHSQVASAVSTSLLTAAGVPPGRECPPMTVTYRLQGLDGEATEPMIKELEDDREESQDPEIEFAIAGVMQECHGLEIILDMVQQFGDAEIKSGHEELALVLKLLMYCCKIRANRQALLRLGALAVLLETARRAFSTDAVEPAEGLLLIVESLVSEANESDDSAGDGTEGQAASAVCMFLERLSRPTGGKQQHNNDTVARILPYLTYGEQVAMEVLVDHFLPYLQDWDTFDRLQKQHCENPKDDGLSHQSAEHQLALDNFVRVTESIKLNHNGEQLKTLVFERGIITVAIQYLKRVFPVWEKGVDHKTSPEWVQGLEMPSVPIILSILRGLARGHRATQQYLDKQEILPLLHGLEGVSGENEIGARAENLLDTLADKDGKGEGFLFKTVVNLRHATRDEMRRRALRRREELLEGLGMRREVRSDGGERIVVSEPRIEGLEEVEEEEAGLSCMVCREGYRLRPTDMLGTYCYSKRVNVRLAMSSHKRSEWVYTTVSHFNVIHFQCHQEAKRADASLKNPKKEWEGATLRNSETLCNNLFPLRGPAVPLAQYARCVDQYWDNLNALGRADGSRLRLLMYDISMMLGRFASNTSFSVDSKGGGRESNSRLLPFMLQMACHLLDQGEASQYRVQAKTLAASLSSTAMSDSNEGGLGFKPSTPTTPQRGASEESVQFMMVQSLLLLSLDDWLCHRRTFLQRGLAHSYAQYKQGQLGIPSPKTYLDFSSVKASPAAESKALDGQCYESKNSALSQEHLFKVIQPMLVYVGLVEQTQRFLKSSSSKAREVEAKIMDECKEEGAATRIGIESWEVTMKERVRDVSTMLVFAKEILEWVEEMQGASDVQEALDIMGVLGDVLSSSCTSCEDFVRNAIAGR